MNPEIYKILDDIRRYYHGDFNKETSISIRSSELLVLLAEENEKASKKIEKLTTTLARLTWVILILTAFLVASLFLELPKYAVKTNQDPNFKTETKQQTIQPDKINKPKESIKHK